MKRAGDGITCGLVIASAVTLFIPSIVWADSPGRASPGTAAVAVEGHRLFQAGQFERAAAKLEIATRAAADPELVFELAVCYERLDRDAEAIATFRAYEARPVALRAREAEQHVRAIESNNRRPRRRPRPGSGRSAG